MSRRPLRLLPKVVLSSVVRSTHQGESHGGVYLVDLETGAIEQKLDWNDPSISWEGRGADRGLRGIAFRDDRLYLAASDEVFVYDKDFRPRGSFTNRYLKHCHEISVAGDALFMASTGYDSVLEYDLCAGRFRRGYCLRLDRFRKLRKKLTLRPRPALSIFDPDADGGPKPGDTTHVNNAFFENGTLYVSGTGLGNLWAIRGERLHRYARIPYGSHNARPFRGGVIMNHTATDRIAFLSLLGSVRRSFPLPRYQPGELVNSDLPRDLARQAFGRGLAVVNEDFIVGGSSPATVTLYHFDPPEVLKSVNITKDVRNAVHGLEVWPFD